MRFTRTLTAAALLATLAAGCGSDDDEAREKPGATPPSSATSGLEGTYRRTVTAADIRRTDPLRQAGVQEGAPEQERPAPGPLALTLTDDTLKLRDPRLDVTVLQDFSATSDGAFRIGAYQHPETGSFCGPDVPQTASYTWKLDGDVLTLTAKQDACADRDSLLSGAWRR